MTLRWLWDESYEPTWLGFIYFVLLGFFFVLFLSRVVNWYIRHKRKEVR